MKQIRKTIVNDNLVETNQRDFVKKGRHCENKNYFGNTLREFRLQRNITQIDAANLLNVTQAQWSSYELGKSRPTLETIMHIAKVLEIDVFDLIRKSIERSDYFKTDENRLNACNDKLINHSKNKKNVVELI